MDLIEKHSKHKYQIWKFENLEGHYPENTM